MNTDTYYDDAVAERYERGFANSANPNAPHDTRIDLKGTGHHGGTGNPRNLAAVSAVGLVAAALIGGAAVLFDTKTTVAVAVTLVVLSLYAAELFLGGPEPGGEEWVRVPAFVAEPWRVIRQATLHEDAPEWVEEYLETAKECVREVVRCHREGREASPSAYAFLFTAAGRCQAWTDQEAAERT